MNNSAIMTSVGLLFNETLNDTKSRNTSTFSFDSESFSTMDRKALLEANDRVATTLMLVLVFFGLLSITGILGNSLVCFVFSRKLRGGSQNFLIICLAVFDLLSCIFAIPYEILDLRFYIYYIFVSSMPCKMGKFFITVCSVSSCLTLLLIAVDRYRKICQPLKKQFTLKHIRIALAFLVAASVLISLPQFFLFGFRTITSVFMGGSKSTVCSTPDALLNTIYPAVYNGLLFFLLVVIAVVLMVLYVKIWRVVKHRNKRKLQGPTKEITESSTSVVSCDDTHNSIGQSQGSSGSETSTTLLGCDTYRLGKTKEDTPFGKSNGEDTQIGESKEQDTQFGKSNEEDAQFGKSKEEVNQFRRLNEEATQFSKSNEDDARFIKSDEKDIQFGKSDEKDIQFDEPKEKNTQCRVQKIHLQSYRKLPDTGPVPKSDEQSGREYLCGGDQGDFFKNSTSTILKEEDTNVTKTQGDKDSLDGTQTNPPSISASTTSPKESTKDNTTSVSKLSDKDLKSSFLEVSVKTSQMPERKEIGTTCIDRENPPTAMKQRLGSSQRAGRTRNRTTLVAFSVTFVFIVSFLPHLSLMIAKQVIAPGFDQHLKGPALAIYNLFMHSYFINCVSNPFIYGVLNLKFRREVKTIYARFFCRQ